MSPPSCDAHITLDEPPLVAVRAPERDDVELVPVPGLLAAAAHGAGKHCEPSALGAHAGHGTGVLQNCYINISLFIGS